MSQILHERPGVYSVYDASSAVSGGRAAKAIGLAARCEMGAANQVVLVTSYAAGASIFGEGAEDGMAAVLRLLFENGASVVAAVRVGGEGSVRDYKSAFDALANQDVQILVCDSPEAEVHQALRDAVTDASGLRRERIAVVGGSGDSVEKLVERAKALNSERVVLAGPDALNRDGETVPGVFSAAALAAVIASGGDPAVPVNGAEIKGLGGLAASYSDGEIDLLVRGGVTPLECVGSTVSPVRGVTTRTESGGGADTTWRELTTILIADDVIPAVRDGLRSKFSRSKNTARSRAAIRSQVIVELERKRAAEIIDGYGEVSVSASPDDPGVCLVEFGFSVAHGLNQVYLTVHITV